MMPPSARLHSLPERILKHDRRLAIALMSVLFAVSAIYTALGVGMNMSAFEMTAMSGMRDMPASRDIGGWSGRYWALVFLMWWVMMVAMMLPSVAPTVLLYAQLMRHGRDQGPNSVRLRFMAFLMGYFLSWAGFSLLATAAHWAAETWGLVSPTMMVLIHTTPGAVLLICAGMFQFSTLKARCLQQCQSPIAFLTRNYRPGPLGALRLGLKHGTFCLGCCWALMTLLFVGGVMNLYWIVALALYVALEKLTPIGKHLSKLMGLALIFWGGYALFS